ncbi:hypothetical protein JQC92_03990 [Shewanella sp. 202IG2-18]|uniref:hypothetical protein n=1 Tax=Parashewanella hymeniacidonis TaxID=2807618 RepID=UPI0019604E15|nr:hypothetical protein [Parashewanella hymeniacidonis]MBM7071203.1 hypothetical protein [Parashewanella hymeniacidonis]
MSIFRSRDGLSLSQYRAIEKVSSKPDETKAQYRLHLQNGKTRDYKVKFEGNRAVSASARGNFWWKYHHEYEEREEAGILYQLNHEEIKNSPCVIDVSSDSSRPLPLTKDEWVSRANLPVNVSNPALTLVLDLDDTLMSKKLTATFNKESSVFEGRYFNHKAMQQISAFQKRGHKVAVLTSATYPFKDVANAFSDFNVGLENARYFDLNHKARKGLFKPDFLDKYAFDESCLYVDDKNLNQSDSTHFHHATVIQPFPELLIEPPNT